MSQLEYREYTITRAKADAAGRQFDGIAVPWDEEIQLWPGEFETVARGACQPTQDQVFVYWRHREVIGQLTDYSDGEAGWSVTGHLSDTTAGRDAATLLADGVVRKLSIGFVPIEWTETQRDDGTTLTTYTRVDVREVSLVPIPAYQSAAVTNVRHSSPHHQETPAMPETDYATRADIATLTDTVDDLERSIATLSHRPPASPATQWRSMGDFLKSVAAGDQDAAEFHRAYTGATTADAVVQDSFVGDFIRLVNARRRHVEIVSTGVLPAEGMSVDYVKVAEDTTSVDEQVDEGDDLPLGKVRLEPGNAPVKTYGGATQLSRQLIERASVPSLNITLEALGRQYAIRTDAAVRAAIGALITDRVDAAATDDTAALELAASTADAWLDVIIDAATAWDVKGYDLATLLVAPATFKALAKLKDGDRRIMAVYGTNTNVIGSIDARGLAGDLANVRVRPSAAVPATAAGAFLDPLAVKFLESPGAPAKLQDSNVINLTEDYSLYGYASVLTPMPDACLPITMGA